MSRMYDRLMAHGFNVAPSFRPLWKYSQEADALHRIIHQMLERLRESRPVVVLADNIAEYFYAGTDQEEWDITSDFPSLAPPWESCFIEYKMPSKIVSSEHGTVKLDPIISGQHHAVIIQTYTVDQMRQIMPENITPHPEAHWTQSMTTFFEVGKGDISLVGACAWNLRSDGSVINPEGSRFYHFIFGYTEAQHYIDAEEARCVADVLTKAYWWPPAYVAALTYSFIHCRNTVIRDVAPEPKLEKANIRRGKPPCVHYKVLEIEPVKKILATQGLSEITGLKHALHICRGHFKDYREHGLFGKLKGLYWWNMHIRGTAKQGMVVKDYMMPPPGGVQ